MATNAVEILENAVIKSYTTGAAVVKGRLVKFSSGTIIHAAATTDNAVGYALDSADSGATVRVAHWGPGVCKALVGTGGATQGAPLKYAADGVTDMTVGGGTTKVMCAGQALQTGVVGDYIGVNLSTGCFTVGS